MLLDLRQSAGDSDKLWAHSLVEVCASAVLADFDWRPRAKDADMMLGYYFATTRMFGLMRWIIRLRILLIMCVGLGRLIY